MPPRSPILLLALLAAASACSDSDTGPEPPELLPGLFLAPVDSGLDFPIYVAAPPGDTRRLFIVERPGRIVLRKDGVRLAQPFADLTALTSPCCAAGVEFGVLGVAFHPQFATNRRFFVYYINADEDARLVEMRAAAGLDVAEPGIVDTILALDINDYAVHYGGTVAFGPDGMLYLGTGDGETGGTSAGSPARDSTSLLGKMLRIDVDAGVPYTVPTDNPFVGRPGWRGEIWLTGLRNPYRWSFDRQTGDLWIADVGEDRREEVTVIPSGMSGLDLGWPVMEGSACWMPETGCDPTGLTPPFLDYSHTEGCSITGGVVYRGSAWDILRGVYLYGDLCRSSVRTVRRDGTMPSQAATWDVGPMGENLVGFGEDAAGEVYVAYAGGRLYRVGVPLPD